MTLPFRRRQSQRLAWWTHKAQAAHQLLSHLQFVVAVGAKVFTAEHLNGAEAEMNRGVVVGIGRGCLVFVVVGLVVVVHLDADVLWFALGLFG